MSLSRKILDLIKIQNTPLDRRIKVDVIIKSTILELRSLGLSYSEIAKDVGVSQSSVRRYCISTVELEKIRRTVAQCKKAWWDAKSVEEKRELSARYKRSTNLYKEKLMSTKDSYDREL